MRVFVLALFIASVVALCHALCDEGYSGSAIGLCYGRPGWVKGGGGKVKDWDNGETLCISSAVSDQECMNIMDDPEIAEELGPADSGYSFDDRTCNVYTRPDCRGDYVSVNKWGWFQFPLGPIFSFRCPCRMGDPPSAPR